MEKLTLLTFVLGEEFFAVNVVKVLEVLEQQQITRVPKAAEHILGIINFRGEILPVIDTRCKFNMSSINEESKNFIIVFDLVKNENRYTVSATADGVKDVIEINHDEIKPVPEMGLSFNYLYIEGVIHRNDAFILLLNPEKVFSIADSEILKLNEEVTH